MLHRAALLCLCLPAWLLANSPAVRPNVLFIAVDDLKPATGAYGDKAARTPALDALAARGTLFHRAYCMQAVCGPSRNAVLTGLRPETLKIYDLATHFRQRMPDVRTLPQHFKEQGYLTQALGKIFHVGHGNQEDAPSWSVPHWPVKSIGYAKKQSTELTREEALFANLPAQGLPRGPGMERADVPDEAYGDGQIAQEAKRRLAALAEHPEQPWFLALGFVKPHLPFCAPEKYWAMHDPDKLPQPHSSVPPEGAPPYATQISGELRAYAESPETGPVSPELTRQLIHGYYAAVSYMDTQLGKVLAELDALKLSDNTIIVLWGDHGWHLGDHGMWCKHSNYEQATRSALMIAAPGKKAAQHSQALVEFVDIYPTLCELAGLPLPNHLTGQGSSLVPLLTDPSASIKAAAHQVYPKRSLDGKPLMGHAVRTERYRYVEWQLPDRSVRHRELYDLERDPDETKNIAGEQPAVVEQHSKRIADRLGR
jgi:iduronate 2-sulfatase